MKLLCSSSSSLHFERKKVHMNWRNCMIHWVQTTKRITMLKVHCTYFKNVFIRNWKWRNRRAKIHRTHFSSIRKKVLFHPPHEKRILWTSIWTKDAAKNFADFLSQSVTWTSTINGCHGDHVLGFEQSHWRRKLRSVAKLKTIFYICLPLPPMPHPFKRTQSVYRRYVSPRAQNTNNQSRFNLIVRIVFASPLIFWTNTVRLQCR